MARGCVCTFTKCVWRGECTNAVAMYFVKVQMHCLSEMSQNKTLIKFNVYAIHELIPTLCMRECVTCTKLVHSRSAAALVSGADALHKNVVLMNCAKVL